MEDKNFCKFLSVFELIFSMLLMFWAGSDPHEHGYVAIVGILFGFAALISLDLFK